MVDIDEVFLEALAAYDEACGGDRCEDGPGHALTCVLRGDWDDDACAAMLLLVGAVIDGSFSHTLGRSSKSVVVPEDADDVAPITEALIAQWVGLAPVVKVPRNGSTHG